MTSGASSLMPSCNRNNCGDNSYLRRPFTPPWEQGAKKTFAQQQQQQQSARSYEDIILATLKEREYASRDDFRSRISGEHRKVVENLLGKAISYLQRTRKIALAHNRDSHETTYRLALEQQKNRQQIASVTSGKTGGGEDRNRKIAVNPPSSTIDSAFNFGANTNQMSQQKRADVAGASFVATAKKPERASVFETLLNQIENGTAVAADRKRSSFTHVSPAMARAAHSLTVLTEPTPEQKEQEKRERKKREKEEQEEQERKKKEKEAQQEQERKKKEKEAQEEQERKKKEKEEQERKQKEKKEQEERKEREKEEQEKRDANPFEKSAKETALSSLTTTTLELRVAKLEQKVLSLESQLQQVSKEKKANEEVEQKQTVAFESGKKKRSKKRPAEEEANVDEESREVNETTEIHWLAKPTHKRLKGALPEAFANMFRGGRKGDASINNIAWYFRRQKQNNEGMDIEEDWHALPKEVSQSIQNAYEHYSLEDRTHPVYKNDAQKILIQFVGLLGEYNGESGRFRRVQ